MAQWTDEIFLEHLEDPEMMEKMVNKFK